MNSRLPTLLAAALLAASCSPKPTEPTPAASIPAPAPVDTAAPTAPAPAAPAPIPQPTPAEEAPVTPPNEAGPEAAAEVAREYFALLGAKQYGQAWALWGSDGSASGASKSEFAGRYAKYATYNATVGKAGDMEGAAGSSYIEFPVKVDATLKSGGAEHLAGKITLRRVNDVPGSTDAQRHWHIQGVELKPAT